MTADWQYEEDLKLLWDRALVFGHKHEPERTLCRFSLPNDSIDLTPEEAEAMARVLKRLASEARERPCP